MPTGAKLHRKVEDRNRDEFQKDNHRGGGNSNTARTDTGAPSEFDGNPLGARG